MKNLPFFENFINEDNVYDNISKSLIFDSSEWISLASFLSKIKKSPEVQVNIKNNTNFGKGVEAVKFLKDKISVPLVVRVYRTQWKWNRGSSLYLNIIVKGLGPATYREGAFFYDSGDSTETPYYSFGKYFNGLIVNGFTNPIKQNIAYGTVQSISNHSKMLQDIVSVFNAYESKYGKPFDVSTALKQQKEFEKIKSLFDISYNKIKSFYSEIFKVNRKLGISIGQPYLVENRKEIKLKINEPRIYRHPDEYGERGNAAINSNEYVIFEKNLSKILDELDKLAKKINYTVEISAE